MPATYFPQTGSGLRIKLELSDDDAARVEAMPRKKRSELTVTALDGERYLLVRWDCTLPGCTCDLLAYGFVDECNAAATA